MIKWSECLAKSTKFLEKQRSVLNNRSSVASVRPCSRDVTFPVSSRYVLRYTSVLAFAIIREFILSRVRIIILFRIALRVVGKALKIVDSALWRLSYAQDSNEDRESPLVGRKFIGTGVCACLVYVVIICLSPHVHLLLLTPRVSNHGRESAWSLACVLTLPELLLFGTMSNLVPLPTPTSAFLLPACSLVYFVRWTVSILEVAWFAKYKRFVFLLN